MLLPRQLSLLLLRQPSALPCCRSAEKAISLLKSLSSVTLRNSSSSSSNTNPPTTLASPSTTSTHPSQAPAPTTKPLHAHAPLSTSATPGSSATSPQLSFRDFRTVFQHASTLELVRAWMVFRICGVQSFVRNADTLLAMSNRLLGTTVTSFIIKHSFFNHFCGGETPEEVWKTMKRLQQRGVSAILDYAAEDDVGAAAAAKKAAPPASAPASNATEGKVVARVYSYESELQCDRHVDTFLNAIDTAGSLPGTGFAAVKLTALGNPDLLERMSNCILTVRGLFQRFDTDDSGCIDRQEFATAYSQVFPDASPEDSARTFSHYDKQAQGQVDYVAWCQGLSLNQMPAIAASIHRAYGGGEEVRGGWLGDLSSSCLTEEEIELVGAMRVRLHTIVERAVEKDVKLMIDAEHTYFQPAIDHMSLQLMKEHNVGGKAFIFNTYQAYLTSCPKRLADDMERANREGYRFAAKLVRGAYLSLERNRASAKGYPSPVWNTLEETHASYSNCLQLVLSEVASGKAEVLLGSHNEESIQQAVKLMQQYGLQPGKSPVYFGQLLGMADHLTFSLGSHGYPAFKYVPYGMVHEVVPYLLRRAQENASILQGAKADVQLLQAEIARRLGWSRASAGASANLKA